MGRKLILSAMGLIMAQIAISKPRLPGHLQIPTGDILPHGQFYVDSRVNLFQTMEPDSSLIYNFPIGAGALLGLGDRAELGLQYGGEISISFKGYVFESSGTDFTPDVAIGIRSVFGSPEGWLHGIEDLDSTRGLRNEAFVALSSNVGDNLRLHLGGAAVSDGGQFPEIFAGLEQYVGGGIYLGYDLFQRFESLHHNLSLVYKLKSYFALSVGFNEFQSWVNQDGEWGFFTSPEAGTVNGYDSPGISVAVSLGGWSIRGNRTTERERLKKIKDEQIEFKDQIITLEKQVEKLTEEVETIRASKSNTYRIENNQLIDYLDMIKNKINSDIPYDPREIEDLQKKIISMRGASRSILKKLITNPTTDADHRVQAIIIIARTGDGAYTEALLKATADPEPKVRREAILALGKMKLQVALEFAETLMDDPDDTVSMAAKAAIKMIQEASGEKIIEKENPEVP